MYQQTFQLSLVTFGSRRIAILHLFHFRDVADEGNVVHKVVERLQLTKVLHVILPDDLRKTEKKNQTFMPHHQNPVIKECNKKKKKKF